MKNFNFILSLILLTGIIFGCGKDNEEPEEDNMIIETIGNNSAILEGDLIGVNSESINNLWKIIDIELENASENFHIDKAFVCRQSTHSSYTYWIIPVENISDNSFVFIRVNNIRFENDYYNLIGSDEYVYVVGEIGHEDLVYTNTFLSGKANGYFIGIKEMPFNDITRIEIYSIESSIYDFQRSSLKILPTNYELADTAIRVEIKNKSSQTLYLDYFPYILLDTMNQPLFWNYLYTIPDSIEMNQVTNIEPGETAYFEGPDFYSGVCNRIRPIINYELDDKKKSSLKSSYSKIKSEKIFEDLLNERNAIELTKEVQKKNAK